DGDAVAGDDEALEVFVGAMHRHAAHRYVAAEMLASLGEHDAERAGGEFGVLEEQLVEIAHPVEQETIRVGGLDLDILLHHRRRPAGALGGPSLLEAGGNYRADGIHGAATLADAKQTFIMQRSITHSGTRVLSD